MSKKKTAVKSSDLGASYDSGINIFGLDAFGEASGLGAIYGAMIGTGVGTLGAIGARSFLPTWSYVATELAGLGAAVLAGGAMVFFPGTRHAGWVAMASAALSNGLRAAEGIFKAPPAPAPAQTPTQGIGLVSAQQLSGVQAVRLNGSGSPINLLGDGGPNIPSKRFADFANNYGSTSVQHD